MQNQVKYSQDIFYLYLGAFRARLQGIISLEHGWRIL